MQAELRGIREALSNVDDRAKLALGASDKAITKAESGVEKKFESHNEFRDQLRDQAHSFVTKREVYLAIGLLIAIAGALLGWFR
jgi:hypothetical protein